MNITVRNVGTTPILIPLPHKVWCKGTGVCSCQVRTIHAFTRDPVSGERKGQEKKVRIHKTLVIPGGKEIVVDDTIRRIPEFRQALNGKRGRVKIITIPSSSPNQSKTKSKKKKKN